jgi:hypothetical protein
LWIPGKQAESPASVQAAQGSAGSSADRDAQSATRAADVARLADAVAADSSVANPAIAAVAELPTDAATVARAPSPGREPESAGAVPDDAVSRAAATSSGGQGEQAGDALPATDSVVSEAPRRAQFSRRELVFLQRTGVLRSVGEAGDADYRSAEADATPATLAVIAAAAPELQVARATLTAAEAALGNRYLETSGEINE